MDMRCRSTVGLARGSGVEAMKGILCTELGPPERLQLTDLPSPELVPGRVLVEVQAAGVNFPDTLIIQGLYQERPNLPFVPGMELAGRVFEVAEDVEGLQPGDRVAAATTTGAFAERALVDARRCVKLPQTVDDTHAASLLIAYGTALHALRQRARLEAGESLLVL